MTFKLELLLLLQKKKKKAHKYKNHLKIMFFMVYLYWTLRFLYEINLFGAKIKKKNLD